MYYIFGGSNYYPAGGWDDFISAHHTEEEARVEAERLIKEESNWYYWIQIVDASALEEIDFLEVGE